MDLLKILIAGLSAATVWILIGSIAYTSRGVKNLYRRSQGGRGVKLWTNMSHFYLFHYIVLFFNSLVASVIYIFIKDGLPDSILAKTLIFGTLICVFQTIPRILETCLRTSYPVNLLFIEFLNYAMSGYAVALTIALIL